VLSALAVACRRISDSIGRVRPPDAGQRGRGRWSARCVSGARQ
jgi:hypothetical protein